MERPSNPSRRSRLARRLRRLGVLCSCALIVWAILLFSGIQLSTDGAHELLNGRGDTHSLVLPLALFLAGICGLALSLG